MQRAMSDILQAEGYQMVSALDGEIGLRLAKSEKPDLILLDLILPKAHGLEVLKTLKGDTETKSIPVIVLTNLEQPEDIERALESGAVAYLVKATYDLSEIMEKIKKAIG